MKVPFYGLEYERHIHLDADPQPLLNELAMCFLNSSEIPTDLASWFFKVFKANRISVAPLAPTKESLARQELALSRFDEYRSTGLSVRMAEIKTIRSLKLKVESSSFKAWRTRRTRVLEALVEEENQGHEEWLQKEMMMAKSQAISDFNALACQGVLRDDALAVVMNRPLQPMSPTPETFQAWLAESDYSRK